MKEKLAYLLLLAAVFALHPPAVWAQYDVPHGVLGSGGGVRSGSNTIYDTACQTAISVSTGGSYRVKSGFWYAAEISSTVDVAVTSFAGEYRDDAVLLRWSVSEAAPLEGFNVYRAEGEKEEELVVINTELISSESGSEYIDEDVIPGRTYLYQIGAVDKNGGEWRSPVISISLPPKPLTLYQNYPNPFNPSTSISFFLPDPRHVTLTIYDTEGRKVKTLVDANREAGKHESIWNGRNDIGNTVGSGVYYCRLEAGKKVITKKMVILR